MALAFAIKGNQVQARDQKLEVMMISYVDYLRNNRKHKGDLSDGSDVPTSSTFLSKQTNHQPTLLFYRNKPATNRQPNEQSRLVEVSGGDEMSKKGKGRNKIRIGSKHGGSDNGYVQKHHGAPICKSNFLFLRYKYFETEVGKQRAFTVDAGRRSWI